MARDRSVGDSPTLIPCVAVKEGESPSLLSLLIGDEPKNTPVSRPHGGTEINDLSVRLAVDLLFEELDEFVFSHAALLARVAVTQGDGAVFFYGVEVDLYADDL
ncbi:MAG: hypothetical protein ACJAU9_001274 [Lentimonas sp.]|jgi:hypothetical protein